MSSALPEHLQTTLGYPTDTTTSQKTASTHTSTELDQMIANGSDLIWTTSTQDSEQKDSTQKDLPALVKGHEAEIVIASILVILIVSGVGK